MFGLRDTRVPGLNLDSIVLVATQVAQPFIPPRFSLKAEPYSIDRSEPYDVSAINAKVRAQIEPYNGSQFAHCKIVTNLGNGYSWLEPNI